MNLEIIIMKKKQFILIKYFTLYLCFIVSMNSCKNIDNEKEVSIGSQVWMKNNLNVDKFRNGDKIIEAKTTEEWENASINGQPAWCYYENNPQYGEKLGKLYNWYAVNDPRGLAPEGWHIPNLNEFKELIIELGGEKKAGKKLKAENGWAYDGNGDNDSGFNALPSGFRMEYLSIFSMLGTNCYFWTNDDDFLPESRAHYFLLQGDQDGVGTSGGKKWEGLSVRCVKD